VPARDVFVRLNESLLGYRPGEAILHRALRVASGIFIATAVALSPCVPLILWRRSDAWETLPTWLTLIPIIAVIIAFLALVFTFLEDGMRRAMYEPARRRTGLAFVIGVMSYVVVPASAFVLYFTLSQNLAASAFEAAHVAVLALMAPPILYVASGKIHEEVRYQDEWASLELG
jgi:hypothetical protein